MSLRSHGGLDIRLAAQEGIEAAIAAHDAVSRVSYAQKLTYFEKCGKQDNAKALLMESKELKPQTKQTISNIVDVNKVAVVNTAFLALGKLVIDTASKRLPKEVGLLGPLVVAEVLAAIPTKNSKVQEAQKAALAYAMYETYTKSDVNSMIAELTGMAEEL